MMATEIMIETEIDCVSVSVQLTWNKFFGLFVEEFDCRFIQDKDVAQVIRAVKYSDSLHELEEALSGTVNQNELKFPIRRWIHYWEHGVPIHGKSD